MRSLFLPLRRLVLPYFARDDQARIVMTTVPAEDIPAGLIAYYNSGTGWAPETVVSGEIKYSDGGVDFQWELLLDNPDFGPVTAVGRFLDGVGYQEVYRIVDQLEGGLTFVIPTGVDFIASNVFGDLVQGPVGTFTTLTASSEILLPSSTQITRNGAEARILTQSLESEATADLTLTTAMQNMTGGSVTFTAARSCRVHVVAFFDFAFTVAGNTTCTGTISINGADHTRAAIMDDAGSATTRNTVGQSYWVSLAAGTHTIRLRASKTANVGTVAAKATHSCITAAVFE